jgi:hypothetical protein
MQLIAKIPLSIRRGNNKCETMVKAVKDTRREREEGRRVDIGNGQDQDRQLE